MKKFFLFAAAAIAAMTVNAAVVTYDFAGIQADQITVDAAGVISTYTMDKGKDTEKTYPAVDYKAGDGTVMVTTISTMANFELQFKNGSATESKPKEGALIFADDYMQTGGKNVVMVFKGLEMDDEIVLHVAAKGSTNATFTVDGATPDPNNAASIGKATKDEESGKYIYTELKFYANGGDVTIKETGGGFRITTAEVTAQSQGIEDVQADVKAVKFFENGQLVIIKNGVRYNALGAQL